MDKLDRIFETQKELDEDIVRRRNLQNIKPEEWIQKQTLAIISELAELLDEVNFKWWKNPKEVNNAAVAEEIVDILHFFVGMCLKMGLSSQDIYDIYIKKNEENFKRQKGTSDKKGYKV